MIRRFAIAAGLALAATSAPANAVLLPAEAERSSQAAQELRTAIATAESLNAAPRVENPALAKLFDAALPGTAMIGPPPHGQEMQLLLGASIRARRLARDYLLIGVGNEAVATPAGRQVAARNFIVFLPEIARLYDFRVRVHARLAGGVARLHETMPNGLRQEPKVAGGFAAIAAETRAVIEATLAAGGDLNIDAGWRIARLTVLLEAAPEFAAMFDVKEGQAIADRALAVAIAENNVTVALMMKNFALALLR